MLEFDDEIPTETNTLADACRWRHVRKYLASLICASRHGDMVWEIDIPARSDETIDESIDRLIVQATREENDAHRRKRNMAD